MSQLVCRRQRQRRQHMGWQAYGHVKVAMGSASQTVPSTPAILRRLIN